MALLDCVRLLFVVAGTSYYTSFINATAIGYSDINFLSEQNFSFDPKIDCDIAKLALDYAKKLLPSRGSFNSVYDALQLQKCNITFSTLQDK